MVDRVGTSIPGIILTVLAVISIIGLKCAPPRVDGDVGFDTIAQEYIEDKRIVFANSDGGQHMESLGEIT